MQAGTPASGFEVWVRRNMRWLSVEETLAHLLSDRSGGNDVIPGTTKRFEFSDGSWPDIATTYNNDGSEMWIGTKDDWHTNFGRTDAHRLAWFILWEWWAKGEWFGLKRWAWYQLLFRRVNRHKIAVGLVQGVRGRRRD